MGNSNLSYKDLVNSFEKYPRNVKSYSKTGTREKWFYVYVHNKILVVSKFDSVQSTTKTSKNEHLLENEFKEFYDFFIKIEAGEIVKNISKSKPRNTQYWFGVISSVLEERKRKKKESTSLKFKKHIIVYIDILGYTNMLENFKSEQMFLTYIHEALTSALRLTEYKNDNNIVKRHIFSDNCIFAIDVENCNDKEMESKMLMLFEFTCIFQHFLSAQRMIYIRGGMTFGNLYMNTDIGYVTGTGLINAYNIEKNEAIYPRIIVTDEIFDYAKSRKGLKEYLIVDLDKKVFLGYLTYTTKMLAEHQWDKVYSPILLDLLLLHKKSILHAIDTYGQDEKIFVKYQWVARYHNVWCKVRNLDKFCIASTGEERFLLPPEITNWHVQGSLFKTGE